MDSITEAILNECDIIFMESDKKLDGEIYSLVINLLSGDKEDSFISSVIAHNSYDAGYVADMTNSYSNEIKQACRDNSRIYVRIEKSGDMMNVTYHA